SATAQTLIQLAAPGQMRGRVMGLYSLTFMGLTPLGALAIGALSEALGVRNGLMVVVGICALGTLATWLYLRRSLVPSALAAPWGCLTIRCVSHMLTQRIHARPGRPIARGQHPGARVR